ncbi:MAG: hypothetical protein ABEJ94_12050 [Halorientalis sp.]
MCHGIDEHIDWDERLRETDAEADEPPEVDIAEPEIEEPELDEPELGQAELDD